MSKPDNNNARAGLAAAALGIAWKSAQAWLTKNNKHAEPDALAACVKSWVKISVSEALADARAAIDCGMSEAAVQTFAASMALAGIEAAKESEVQ